MTRKDDLEMEKDAALPEEIGTDSDGMGAATLGGYVNPYAGQIQELYQNISSRQPFQYDVDSDAMYQALKDQYITGGKLAMMDTMGQAAQLTGGYGNSYAQGVGQQAYQGYLQGLNDQLPDLYNMALQNYIQTGDAMLQEYGMLQDMAADDYGKYQDQMALVQPQVLEMIQAGVMPSDEMIAQSGLSREYIDAMYPGLLDGSGGDSGWKASDWFHADGTVKLNRVKSDYRDAAAEYNVNLKGEGGGRGNRLYDAEHGTDYSRTGDDYGDVPMYGDVAEAAAQAWEAWSSADIATKTAKVNEILNAARADGFPDADAAAILNWITTGGPSKAKG